MSYPVKNRLDFFASHLDTTKNLKFGRKHHRNELNNEKFQCKVGTGSGKGSNESETCVVKTQPYQFKVQRQFENDILQLNVLLSSASGQRDACIEMAKIYSSLGDCDQSRSEMRKATELMTTINKMTNEVKNLKSIINSSEVDEVNNNKSTEGEAESISGSFKSDKE